MIYVIYDTMFWNVFLNPDILNAAFLSFVVRIFMNPILLVN